MGKQVVLFVLVALATLQVLQAMGLDKMPFPDTLDEESDNTIYMFISMSLSWNISTRWLGDLRSSYSQILRYETSDTLTRMTHFAENVETGANKYKDDIQEILADVENPRYSNCTQENKFQSIRQEVSTADNHLQECTVALKALRDKYRLTLDTLTAQINSRSEETIYTSCQPARYTLTLVNRARKCFYANLQAALTGFYYPMGTSVLRRVDEFRSSIAHERGVAYACAETALSPATAQRLMGVIEATRSCLQDSPRQRSKRGFGKKFKKFFKKAKKGIKKVCSKVPCQVGYSTAFG